MVNFAELKAKAEKVKDAGITKVTNTRDRLSSTPSSRTNWDPNWKRAPPPPAPPRGTSVPPPPPPRTASGGPAPPVVSRTSRPTDDLSAPPRHTPPPPPSRASSSYPPSHRETPPDAEIDWVNLSAEDKEVFFEWLDEFFSRHLQIELGPRERRSEPLAVETQSSRPRPVVNMATRPQM